MQKSCRQQAGRLSNVFTAKRWEHYLSTSLAVRIQHLHASSDFWSSEIGYACISLDEAV